MDVTTMSTRAKTN